MTEGSMDYLLVSQKLEDLGWTWIHPRICAYVADLNKVYNLRFDVENLPKKHYKRLMDILSCIERINQELKVRTIGWDDPLIVDFFNKSSTKDQENSLIPRLTFKQWLELEKYIHNETCPF